MENNISSPINLTRRSIERNGNVLKELNNLDEVTKSSKDAPATDQQEIFPKSQLSLPRVDSPFATNSVVSSQSSDDEFIDCNTTIRSKESDDSFVVDTSSNLDSLIDGLANVQLNDPNATVIVNNPVLNVDFLEVEKSDKYLIVEGTQIAGENEAKDETFSCEVICDAEDANRPGNRSVTMERVIDEPCNTKIKSNELDDSVAVDASSNLDGLEQVQFHDPYATAIVAKSDKDLIVEGTQIASENEAKDETFSSEVICDAGDTNGPGNCTVTRERVIDEPCNTTIKSNEPDDSVAVDSSSNLDGLAQVQFHDPSATVIVAKSDKDLIVEDTQIAIENEAKDETFSSEVICDANRLGNRSGTMERVIHEPCDTKIKSNEPDDSVAVDASSNLDGLAQVQLHDQNATVVVAKSDKDFIVEGTQIASENEVSDATFSSEVICDAEDANRPGNRSVTMERITDEPCNTTIKSNEPDDSVAVDASSNLDGLAQVQFHDPSATVIVANSDKDLIVEDTQIAIENEAKDETFSSEVVCDANRPGNRSGTMERVIYEPCDTKIKSNEPDDSVAVDASSNLDGLAQVQLHDQNATVVVAKSDKDFIVEGTQIASENEVSDATFSSEVICDAEDANRPGNRSVTMERITDEPCNTTIKSIEPNDSVAVDTSSNLDSLIDGLAQVQLNDPNATVIVDYSVLNVGFLEAEKSDKDLIVEGTQIKIENDAKDETCSSEVICDADDANRPGNCSVIMRKVFDEPLLSGQEKTQDPDPINDVLSGNSKKESQQPISDSAIVGPLDAETTPTVSQAGQLTADVAENVTAVDDVELNVYRTQLSSTGSTASPQDSTFFWTSNEKNETILVEQSFEDLQSNQLEKMCTFKANPTFSADSLEDDNEKRDCSLDSLEMEQSTNDNSEATNEQSVASLANERIDLSNQISPAKSTLRDDTVPQDLNEPASKLRHQSDSTFVTEKSNLTNLKSADKPIIRRQTFNLPVLVNEETEIPATQNLHESVSESTATAPSQAKPHSNDSTFVNDVIKLLNNKSPSSNDVDCEKRRTFPMPAANTEAKEPETPTSNEDELLPQMVLNSTDFDFLASRGANPISARGNSRDSLLLRFDPLSGGTPQKPNVALIAESSESRLTTETGCPDSDPTVRNDSLNEQSPDRLSKSENCQTNAVEMSVRLVHDSNTMDSEPDSYVKSDDKLNADDVSLNDKNFKLEYADRNIKKKMEEYEATQEILTKRLTEKDKTLSKNCAIIEAYEKALAELVTEKEKLTEKYAIANEEIRMDRDIHHQHLMSLETTFSDLHKKYEHSKEITSLLQDRLQLLSKDLETLEQLLKEQESRYQKMKEHALERLEYANSTLEEQERNNLRENTRLKALLKIEEVNRNTLQEQLLQKTKENEELVKICDELIGGQNS